MLAAKNFILLRKIQSHKFKHALCYIKFWEGAKLLPCVRAETVGDGHCSVFNNQSFSKINIQLIHGTKEYLFNILHIFI